MRNLTNRALGRTAISTPLCRSCQLQRRRFVSSGGPPPRPPTTGLAALPSRQLLSVAGPDAAKFLQGIVTANVAENDGQPRQDAFYAGFLNATGRVVHDVFIYPFAEGSGLPVEGDGFLIEGDANQITRLTKYIKRYKLRAKINVRSVTPDQVSVWQAWDESPAAQPLNPSSNESRITMRDPRAPGLGYRILQFNNKTPELDLDTSTEEAYTIRRYLNGVPEGQDELLPEQALPLESNMELMGGIDFHKGCYVGQELTIRTKHRGVVRKRVLPCVTYPVDSAPPHTLVYNPEGISDASPERLTADMVPSETSIGRSGKRGRSAGKWLRGLGNVGLGLCRLEIMTDVVLPGEQAAATYEDGDEFVVEWGEQDNRSGLKVKAFVPEWLRSGLTEQQR